MNRIALALLVCLVPSHRDSSAQEPHPTHHFFELGDFALELGETLPNARVLYVTHGTLNADRSNAVLIPSWYGGNHHGYDFLIGPDRALDPADYFVIVTEMFASGGSTSPSNTVPPQTHAQFPRVTIRDNVAATHRLVTEAFGIGHLRAIIGFSMGAEQAFQWAVSHPDFMDLIVPIAGTAKTYPHGIVRLTPPSSPATTRSRPRAPGRGRCTGRHGRARPSGGDASCTGRTPRQRWRRSSHARP